MAFNAYSRSNPMLPLPLATSGPQQVTFVLVFTAIPGIIVIYCKACSSFLSNDLDVCEGHIEKHHPHLRTAPYIFQCGNCRASFDDKQKVSDHHRLLSKKHICQVRHQSFSGHSNQRASVDRVPLIREEKLYRCEHCGKCFRGSSVFGEHTRTCASKQRYVCDICNKVYKSEEMLNYHTTLCKTADKIVVCDFCDIPMMDLDRLTRHRYVEHQVPFPTEPYLCKYCFKEFKEIHECRDHMKTCFPKIRMVFNFSDVESRYEETLKRAAQCRKYPGPRQKPARVGASKIAAAAKFSALDVRNESNPILDLTTNSSKNHSTNCPSGEITVD